MYDAATAGAAGSAGTSNSAGSHWDRGGADDATRSRGLEDVSPAPNAAVLDVELLPPSAATGGAAALVAATLRVRIEARWKEA
jgi:hypothetical protein